MSDSLSSDEPLIPATTSLPELTFKVIVISILLAVLLAAANAYLALKIGTTISASIPASVLAISILRLFKKSNVLESNIIQTAASAGEGIAAAVAYILPAMILLHIWDKFPFWEVALITSLGGILGVIFSIPLRRVMLNMPTLRFPEGTAIGNVLRISSQSGTKLRLLAQGGAAGSLLALAENGFEFIASNLQVWSKFSNNAVVGFGVGFSPATLAAGYIIGAEAATSILVGFIGGWLMIFPYLTAHLGEIHGSVFEYAMSVWSSKLRYVGVGLMLVGGVWTLIRLLKPVMQGLALSCCSLRNNEGDVDTPRTERDIPFKYVLVSIVAVTACLYWLVMHFISDIHLVQPYSYLVFAGIISVLFLLLIGFTLSMICSYFAGLVGSTNNPLSGMLIIAILILGIIFLNIFPPHLIENQGSIAGLMLLITAIVSCTSVISSENLQDLKAGKMVGATPWKQQLILVVGVLASAVIIGPILQLLFDAYGIGGVFPHAHMNPRNMLAAPQAGLMEAIATGVRTHHLPWEMIYIGSVFAFMVIIADLFLRNKKNMSLPVLAVGLGVYLPPEITLPFVIGGYVSYLAKDKVRQATTDEDKNKAFEKTQDGILLACGLVAGAAIMGVLLAIPFVIMGSSDALSIVSNSFGPVAKVLGVFSMIGLCYWLYSVSR